MATTLIIASFTTVSNADTEATPLSRLAASPMDAGAGAQAILEGTRRGTPSEVLSGMLAAQGLDATAHPVPAVSSPGMPAPIAALATAAHLAEQLRLDALAALTPAEERIVAAGLMTSTIDTPVHPGGAGGLIETRDLVRHDVAERIAAKVDERALRDAAMTVLRTIERVTPALLMLPQSELSPSACGASGDMLFESSDCDVIVGGTDANSYPAGVDPTVLIDVAGDDIYSNGAARAAGNVRIVLDLAGNDTYTDTAVSATPGGPVTHAAGQGAGILGVGILADLGGIDGYTLTATATAPEPGPVAATAQATGQGAAIAGVGILVDAGNGDDPGTDVLDVSASSTGGAALVLAQGQSTIGLGALLSLGEGNGADVYRATARSTLHTISRTDGLERFSIGNAASVAQGATDLAGAGLLADRSGADTYLSRAEGAAGRTIAQGGSVGGAGLLVDVDGDDTMTSEAIGDATLSLITTNPAVCWSVSVMVTTSATSAIGQGGAGGGGAGLIDGTGDDHRTLLASSRAEGIAEARSNHDCTAFGGNAAHATARTGSADATGQGAALLGVGVLIDLAGSDHNDLDASAESVARAIAISPGPDIEEASADAGEALAQGQGFSAVGLTIDADLGGADTRSSRAWTTASETTSAGTTTDTVPGEIRVHGWVNGGRSYLVDAGGTDTYTTDPAGISAAGDDRCWSNTPDARGIDLTPGIPLPAGCP